MESEWDIDEIPGVTQHRYGDGLFVDGKNLLLLCWFPGNWNSPDLMVHWDLTKKHIIAI
jgi:hypothetical protein